MPIEILLGTPWHHDNRRACNYGVLLRLHASALKRAEPRVHMRHQFLSSTHPLLSPFSSKNITNNLRQNIYYGTLYAYTPEVLPSAHRGTGNGISIGLNRIMGIVSAGVATGANTATPVPIYICAALYIVMAIVAGSFPYEPMGRRSS